MNVVLGLELEVILVGFLTFVFFILLGAACAALLSKGKQKSQIKVRMERMRNVPEELRGELSNLEIEGAPQRKGLFGKVDLQPVLGKFTGDDYFERTETELAKADIPLRVSEFIIIRLMLVAIGTLLAVVITKNPVSALIALPLLFLHIPFIKIRQNMRIAKFGDQLAEFLILIVNSLRAGQTFMQGCSVAVVESPNPISTEFRQVIKEVNLGMQEQESMQNMLMRVPSEELKIVISAYIIQRKVGGNLAEILETTAETIRERIKIQGQIKVLTTQGKLSGFLVGLLPVVLGFILVGLNPEYMQPLIGTLPGYICIGIAVIMQAIGAFVIWKIVDIEI
jgi:tight adherence protein B